MTRLFVLICSLALVWAAAGETESEKQTSSKHHKPPPKEHQPPPKEHQPPPKEHQPPPKEHQPPPKRPPTPGGQPPPGGSGPTQPERPPETSGNTAKPAPSVPVYHYDFPGKRRVVGRDFTRPLTPEEYAAIAKQIADGQPVGTQAPLAPFRLHPFNLPDKPDPNIQGAKFQGDGHINGSETWTGDKYAAFRDYHHEWHDKDWWEHHRSENPTPSSSPKSAANPRSSPSPKPSPGPKSSPIAKPSPSVRPSPSSTPPPDPTATPPVIVLVGGGYYYRHGCYWYPAWGYDPRHSYYPYDGPIYSCSLTPDQMVANVQAALQALGYYNGPINGLLGWRTRAALAAYQRDLGLYVTRAIDEPTLAALGMV